MTAPQYFYEGDILRNTAGFTAAEKEILTSVAKLCTLPDFLDDAYLSSKACFEFVYASAKIEGSRITRQQASIIISSHQSVGGLPIADVLMTANLAAACRLILNQDLTVNLAVMHRLHAYLARGLISDPRSIGAMKTAANKVTGDIEYLPLAPGELLKSETEEMLRLYSGLSDPFDRALYLHNSIAYLQYFADCNKRTARCMMTVSMKQDQVLPFFIFYTPQTAVDYLNAIGTYYETGSNQEIKDFFLNNYLLLGKEIENAQLIQLVNGDIHSYAATAVIKTNDPLNIKILSQIGEEKVIRQVQPGRLYFVEMYKLHGSGINPAACRAYASLDAFINNRQAPLEALEKIIGRR